MWKKKVCTCRVQTQFSFFPKCLLSEVVVSVVATPVDMGGWLRYHLKM
jgi:hypothetical protein